MNIIIAHHHRFELWNAPAWLAERLQREFPQHRFIHLNSYDEMEQHIADADVLIGWSIRPEQLARAKRLKWIHSPAAAVHQLMYPELVASDIVVTNSGSVHGPVVAEHVIALMFAMAKSLPAAMRYQREHQWAQQRMWTEAGNARPREITGATLAIIGLGSIGGAVASHARALGMHVIAVREHPERGAAPAHEIFARNQIYEVLARAEFVVLAAPVTGESRAMIGAPELAAMRPDAYLINVSRGALIDEAALIQALQARKIAGAALDVFEREPLPSESPLWDLPNVLITPHTAAVTGKLWERHFQLISENMVHFENGEPLRGTVDKHRGY